MKKVAIIGTNGLPGRYGGWDQLLNHLTFELSSKYEIVVYTSSYNAVKGLKEYNGAKLKVIPLKANGFQSVLYDAVSMIHAGFKYDIMLVLGTSGCIFLPVMRLFGKKIILNPDGAEWKRGKWNRYIKWFLKKSEDFGIRFSDIIVSDNKIIQEYISQEYSKSSALIAYGGDNAKYVELRPETANRYGIINKGYAFKVCRIEPENNIDLILAAFQKVDMKLILIGNWEYSEYGSNLRNSYIGAKNLLLLDPIYEQATLDELRSNCGLYVHGHSVGGTNPSLVEAMNLGLLCLTFDVDYNRETTENKAIYFKSSDELLERIQDYSTGMLEEARVRADMLEIAKRRYTWTEIVKQYNALFS